MSKLLTKKQDECLDRLFRDGPAPLNKFDAKTVKSLLKRDLVGVLYNKFCPSDPRMWLVVLTRSGRSRVEGRMRR